MSETHARYLPFRRVIGPPLAYATARPPHERDRAARGLGAQPHQVDRLVRSRMHYPTMYGNSGVPSPTKAKKKTKRLAGQTRHHDPPKPSPIPYKKTPYKSHPRLSP